MEVKKVIFERKVNNKFEKILFLYVLAFIILFVFINNVNFLMTVKLILSSKKLNCSHTFHLCEGKISMENPSDKMISTLTDIFLSQLIKKKKKILNLIRISPLTT